MYLRKFTLDDYEEVVDMYYEFIKEVFGDIRQLSPKYFYYKKVIDCINSKKHIVLSVSDVGVITGFSLCYVDEFDGLTNPVYSCEIAYVKPTYRNTKSAYMLYHNGSKVAKELGLNLITNGRIENGTSKMMEKHFSLDAKFINFERKA